MKRISFALAMVLALLTVYSGASYGGEFPYELKGCGTSERTIIDKADDVVIGQSLARGVTESVPQGGPFDKMIYECGGHWQLSKTGFEISQSCTFVDSDGDKTLGTTVGNAQGWDWKFIAGTGKWKGITGGGPTKPVGKYGRLQAVSAGCWHGKGTYQLP
ncbi:MAG: hypothetical protein V2J65_18320 [Desulfobacteraceae bacterium]|jgi:hypothetical protein|nr:hypothetical protein [Desulfobacteraceae bacterium]